MPRRQNGGRAARTPATRARTVNIRLHTNIGLVLGKGRAFVTTLENKFHRDIARGALSFEWAHRQNSFVVTSESDRLIAAFRGAVKKQVDWARNPNGYTSAPSSRKAGSVQAGEVVDWDACFFGSDDVSMKSCSSSSAKTSAVSMATSTNPFAMLEGAQDFPGLPKPRQTRPKKASAVKTMRWNARQRAMGVNIEDTPALPKPATRTAVEPVSPPAATLKADAPKTFGGFKVVKRKGRKKARTTARTTQRAPKPVPTVTSVADFLPAAIAKAKPTKKAKRTKRASPESFEEAFPELTRPEVWKKLEAPETMKKLIASAKKFQELEQQGRSVTARSAFTTRRAAMSLAGRSSVAFIDVALGGRDLGLLLGSRMGYSYRNLRMMVQAVREQFGGEKVGIKWNYQRSRLEFTGKDCPARKALSAIAVAHMEATLEKLAVEATEPCKPAQELKVIGFRAQKRSRADIRNKRLARDLLEIQTMSSLDYVAAHVPNPEEPEVWHVNFRLPSDNPLSQAMEAEHAVLHAALRFPEAYPFAPPNVTFLPGLAKTGKGAPRSRVNNWLKQVADMQCLAVMQLGEQWSAAYTAAGALMQIQSFLNNAQSQTSAKTVGKLVEQVTAYKCASCEHCVRACVPCLPERRLATKNALADNGDVKLLGREIGCFLWRIILAMTNDEDLHSLTTAFACLDRVRRGSASERLFRESRCFVHKVDTREATLGIGMAIVNKSRKLTMCGHEDSLVTDGDLVSLAAWRDGVQFGAEGRGEQGEKEFSHWIPLAMNAAHFRRVVQNGSIEEALQCISGKSKLTPAMYLDTVCGLMKHVLVSMVKVSDDNCPKQALCEANVRTFCHLHHLVLALDKLHKGELRRVAAKRLRTFAAPGGCVKAMMHDMNLVFVYLCLFSENEMSWASFAHPIVNECLVRGHKWTVATEPHLDQDNCPDTKRVNRTFELRTTSIRFHLFFRAFLNHICRWERDGRVLSAADMLAHYDANCGSPPPVQVDRLYAAVKAIYTCRKWTDYFAQMALADPPNTPKALAEWLKAVRMISLQRGYHTQAPMPEVARPVSRQLRARLLRESSTAGTVTAFDRTKMAKSIRGARWSNPPSRLRVKADSETVNGVYIRRGLFEGYPVWEREDGEFRIYAWAPPYGTWWLGRKITCKTNPDFYRGAVNDGETDNVARMLPHRINWAATQQGVGSCTVTKIKEDPNTFNTF